MLPKRLSPLRSPPQRSNVGDPVGKYPMPRFSSIANSAQVLAPPAVFHASGGHVS